MVKRVVYAVRCAVVRVPLEYWRWRMVRVENDQLRLLYSQQCDRWIVRYQRLSVRRDHHVLEAAATRQVERLVPERTSTY